MKRYTQATEPTSSGRILYAGDGRVLQRRTVYLSGKSWSVLHQLAAKSRISINDVIASLAAIANTATNKPLMQESP